MHLLIKYLCIPIIENKLIITQQICAFSRKFLIANLSGHYNTKTIKLW